MTIKMRCTRTNGRTAIVHAKDLGARVFRGQEVYTTALWFKNGPRRYSRVDRAMVDKRGLTYRLEIDETVLDSMGAIGPFEIMWK